MWDKFMGQPGPTNNLTQPRNFNPTEPCSQGDAGPCSDLEILGRRRFENHRNDCDRQSLTRPDPDLILVLFLVAYCSPFRSSSLPAYISSLAPSLVCPWETQVHTTSLQAAAVAAAAAGSRAIHTSPWRQPAIQPSSQPQSNSSQSRQCLLALL